MPDLYTPIIINPKTGEPFPQSLDLWFDFKRPPRRIRTTLHVAMREAAYLPHGVELYVSPWDPTGWDSYRDWVSLGHITVEADLNPPPDLVSAKVDSLKAEITRLRAETEAKCTSIQESINQLLCLPSPSE